MAATREMVQIMQEFGEVVLVIGSSLNMDNTRTFLQANCRWVHVLSIVGQLLHFEL